jgi:exopolysaccharide biosynthesis polyprenyl glycosylphosphotransferase
MGFIRREGLNSRLILIIADEDSVYFIDRLIESKDWGYRIWAIMSDNPGIKEKYGLEYLIIPYERDLSLIIDKRAIDEVFYCKSSLEQNEIQKFIYSCAEVGVVFRMQSLLLNYIKMQSSLSYLNQMPFLTFRNTPDNYLALKFKVIFDSVISILAIILLFPLMVIIALLIKLDGGPVFFRQKRTGLYGRQFFCYKFRTMVVDAESQLESLSAQNEQEGPFFKNKHDPRVTWIGRFLRRTSLDEIPQFINVFKGEMAIVGPRPPIPSEVEQYERWQQRRLSMKPGITCIWQVSGRNNIPFDQWMKMDMQYIDTWSLKLDFIIILKTIRVVITSKGC